MSLSSMISCYVDHSSVANLTVLSIIYPESRSGVSIIPQDPVLFSGSIRYDSLCSVLPYLILSVLCLFSKCEITD